MTCRNLVLVALGTVVAAGCGDQPDAVASETRGSVRAPRMTTNDYKAARAKAADSLLKSTKPTGQVVKDLGTEYLEAPPALRDSLAVLSAKAGCFATGRGADPFLAGTAQFFVYTSSAGSEIVRVEKSSWTSEAGNVVNACLNLAAKDWKFGTEYGKSGVLVAQVQFK